MANSLVVSEIFYSLQGEASRVGLPTVFIRLTGCPLRCQWCDTAHAFMGGASMAIEAVLAAVVAYPAKQVCVTGGEPLAQKQCLELLVALCDAGYDVSLETSGALDISTVDARVSRVVDLKAPSSQESHQNLWPNIEHLRQGDEVKIIIATREDYDWAVEKLAEYRLAEKAPVLFSPAQDGLSPTTLADWILQDGLPVRFQLQLHKLLWGNARGK